MIVSRRSEPTKNFVSKVDQYLMAKVSKEEKQKGRVFGIIKRDKIVEFWANTHVDEYNTFLKQHVNTSKAYIISRLWKEVVHDFLSSIKDSVKVDDDDQPVWIRRYAYVKSRDGYAFLHTLKDKDGVSKAKEAVNEKRKNADACLNSAKIDSKAIERLEAKIEQEAKYRAWDEANPRLFGDDGGIVANGILRR